MNDDPELDPELDPGQEQQVRALLADLGAAPDVTMPPEVAARLEETLSELGAELGAELAAERRPTVVPLRRRWAPRAAAAAAAVIVIGAGGVAAANLLGGSSGDTAGSADSSAGGSTSQESSGGRATATPKTAPGAQPDALARRLPRVSAASFGTDVERLVRRRAAVAGDSAAGRSPQEERKNELQQYAGSCPGPATSPRSTVTPVLYDGTRAALVLHPVHGGHQLVEAWTCAGDRKLDSADVPAPQDGQSDPGLASPSSSP
jgi:hypothetical protein